MFFPNVYSSYLVFLQALCGRIDSIFVVLLYLPPLLPPPLPLPVPPPPPPYHTVTCIPIFPLPKSLIPFPALLSPFPSPSPRGQRPSKPLACEARGALGPAFLDKQFEAEFLIHTRKCSLLRKEKFCSDGIDEFDLFWNYRILDGVS